MMLGQDPVSSAYERAKKVCFLVFFRKIFCSRFSSGGCVRQPLRQCATVLGRRRRSVNTSPNIFCPSLSHALLLQTSYRPRTPCCCNSKTPFATSLNRGHRESTRPLDSTEVHFSLLSSLLLVALLFRYEHSTPTETDRFFSLFSLSLVKPSSSSSNVLVNPIPQSHRLREADAMRRLRHWKRKWCVFLSPCSPPTCGMLLLLFLLCNFQPFGFIDIFFFSQESIRQQNSKMKVSLREAKQAVR
jgi:hypothetical protein